ncbi:hypothetical protein IVB27_23555 [Bradyrhizobium sp. 197]|jgi:hypothetical protein|nr:hypothetical protein [Bradyrhizobium sp. 197]
MKEHSCAREDAVKLLAVENVAEHWQNSLFLVLKYHLGSGWFKLRIERHDGEPIIREWRLFQSIKNQLLGSECEALELYPAESRKVDSANMYHLYGVADPKVTFRFGMTPTDIGGKVIDVSHGRSKPASYK